MNKAYIKLENELRDEIMLRKLHKRSEKYGYLSDNEVCILVLAMVRKICRNENGKSDGVILEGDEIEDGAGDCQGSHPI